MAEIPPLRNLPQEAEPWGRWVEGEIRAARTSQSRVAEETRNANSTTGGSFNQIAAQIDEINKRRIYIGQTDGVLYGGPPALSQELTFTSFVLEERRNVLFQAFSPTRLTVNNANAVCRSVIRVTGIPDTAWGGGAYGTVSISNGATAYSIVEEVVNTIYWQQALDPGSYRIGLTATTTLTGASSTIDFIGAAVSAQVLDRA